MAGTCMTHLKTHMFGEHSALWHLVKTAPLSNRLLTYTYSINRRRLVECECGWHRAFRLMLMCQLCECKRRRATRRELGRRKTDADRYGQHRDDVDEDTVAHSAVCERPLLALQLITGWLLIDTTWSYVGHHCQLRHDIRHLAAAAKPPRPIIIYFIIQPTVYVHFHSSIQVQFSRVS